MPKSISSAILIWVMIASPALASPSNKAKEVAEAKASLEELADEQAIELWNARPAWMDKLQLTMEFNRNYGRWLATGISIGMCEAYAKPALIADWLSKIDAYSRTLGGEFGQTRRDVEASGMRFRRSGQQNSVDDELPPASAKSYCEIELEAARQVLLGL